MSISRQEWREMLFPEAGTAEKPAVRVIPRLTVALPICWSVVLAGFLVALFAGGMPSGAVGRYLDPTDSLATIWWAWSLGVVAAAGIGRLLDWLLCRPGPLP